MSHLALLVELVPLVPLLAGGCASFPGSEAGGPCNDQKLCIAPLVCGAKNICRQPPDQIWDSSTWTAVTTPGMEIKALWGTTKTDVWAVGPDGVFHYAGDPAVGWQKDFTLPAEAAGHALYGVWGRMNEVWAVGDRTILHRAGGSWENQSIWSEPPYPGELTSYFTLNSVAGSQSTVWATGVTRDGTIGEILRLQGSEWKRDTPPEDCWPNAVTVVGEQAVVVGKGRSYPYLADPDPVWGGCVFINDNGSWGKWTLAANLEAVWGAAVTDIVAVGEAAKMFRYSGIQWTWSDDLQGLSSAHAICGTRADDLYVVGVPDVEMTAASPVLHCGLSGCVPVLLPADMHRTFQSVWCGGDGTVMVAGAGGVTYQRAGP